MTIALTRHGPAETGRPGQPDAERSLTPAGLELVRKAARSLALLDPPVERIWTSPYRRAHQTAMALGAETDSPVEEDALLAVGASFDDFAEVASRFRGEVQLLVSHQPSLGRVIEQLCGARVHMRPGALALLTMSRFRHGAARLDAFYQPETLARLAESLESQ